MNFGQNCISYDSDEYGYIWFDIGTKGGNDTTDWNYWNSHGNVTFRSGSWSGNEWHGP